MKHFSKMILPTRNVFTYNFLNFNWNFWIWFRVCDCVHERHSSIYFLIRCVCDWKNYHETKFSFSFIKINHLHWLSHLVNWRTTFKVNQKLKISSFWDFVNTSMIEETTRPWFHRGWTIFPSWLVLVIFLKSMNNCDRY